MESRSPHGERGLKFPGEQAPRRHVGVALLTESVDWNSLLVICLVVYGSRSPHGERGLKSPLDEVSIDSDCRSPHGERGLKLNYEVRNRQQFRVALLTESVDWNDKSFIIIQIYVLSLSSRRAWIEIKKADRLRACGKVALLTESVDWNIYPWRRREQLQRSLSSRRAWIEIFVALLTESVDWNIDYLGE